MLSGNKSFWQRKRREILIAASIVASLVAFVLLYEPSTPDGVYYWPGLACGHGVWIFKDGKIYEQCVGENNPRRLGFYTKSGNRWVAGKSDDLLKPSIFGIMLYGASFKNGHEFFFRNQLSWVIDCEEWFQLHF